MDSSGYFSNLEDLSTSFEFTPQYSPLVSTPYQLPKKPCQQQQQQLKGTLVDHRPQYSDDIPGIIDFTLSVNVGDAPTFCIYSKKLQRIYTTMDQPLRICFNWEPTYQPLFLRSAIVFAEGLHESQPVKRCYTHRALDSEHNAGVTPYKLSYVFRVSHPTDAYQTVYEPNIDGLLTTKTMLRSDLGGAWLDYRFFCQNSCATGIGRRATKMLFVIEDAMGVVIAKRSVLIQICANPKRDKERDENRVIESESKRPKKKKPTQPKPQPPQPPVIAQHGHDEDTTVYALDVDILGEENYKKVLQYAYDVMAAQAIRTGNHQLLKPHMDAILKKENEE